MGSWNGTCGVSNLPIQHGDKVVMLPIAQAMHYNPDRPSQSACHNTTFWEPIGFPVRAKYNDYGWIEKIEDNSFTEWNLAWIRDNLIEREIGENTHHDHAVKRDNISWESLGEIFHGDRLWLKSHNHRRKHRCGFFMLFRQDLYDLLSTKTVFESYSPKSVDYRGDLALIEDTLREDLGESSQRADRYTVDSTGMSEEAVEALNALSRFDDYELRDKYRPHQPLLKYRNTNPDSEEAFVKEFSRLRLFDIAMSDLRKHYTPMTGAGSQSTGFETHKLLAAEVLKIAEEGCRPYEEDEEDE